jgi:hypothetical protein
VLASASFKRACKLAKLTHKNQRNKKRRENAKKETSTNCRLRLACEPLNLLSVFITHQQNI